MNNEIFEKKVLKLNVDDASYIFIKPEHSKYRERVLLLTQDSKGVIRSEILNGSELLDFLNQDQLAQVLEFTRSGRTGVLKSEPDNEKQQILEYGYRLQNQLNKAKLLLKHAKEQIVSQSQHLAVQNGKLSVFENMMQLFKGDRHSDRLASCVGDNHVWQIDNFLRQAEDKERSETGNADPRGLSSLERERIPDVYESAASDTDLGDRLKTYCEQQDKLIRQRQEAFSNWDANQEPKIDINTVQFKSPSGLDTLGKGLHGDTYNQKTERPSNLDIGLGGLNDQ
jgi:hypothetical protein